MSAVTGTLPAAISPKRAEADQFETRDFYVAAPCLLRPGVELPKQAVDLPNHQCVLCSLDGERHAYWVSNGEGLASMALSGTTAEGRGEGDGLGLSVTKYRTGSNTDELDNRAEYHPHLL